MSLVVVATDTLSWRNLTRLAAALDLDLVQLPSPDQLAGIEAPVAVVIDVELEGAMAAVTETKERWPLTMVVGLVSLPGGDIWNRAEQSGCDLVTTRGAVTKLVPPRLARWIEARVVVAYASLPCPTSPAGSVSWRGSMTPWSVRWRCTTLVAISG